MSTSVKIILLAVAAIAVVKLAEVGPRASHALDSYINNTLNGK